MYYPYFLTYILAGLTIGIVVFFVVIVAICGAMSAISNYLEKQKKEKVKTKSLLVIYVKKKLIISFCSKSFF